MDIKYIFCISPGRSGSNYLSKVFDCIEGVHSEHEPLLTMNGSPMMAYLEGDKAMMVSLMQEKMEAIEQNRGDGIYFESNHCFIKGFGWEIFNYIKQSEVAVIELRREKEKVVDSYARIGSDPFGVDGAQWFVLPRKTNLIKPPINVVWFKIRRFILAKPYTFLIKKGLRGKKIPSWNLKMARRLLGWYYDETYALAEKFRKTYPEVSYLSINIDELNDQDGVAKLLNKLSLDNTINIQKLNKVVGKPSNLKKR